MLLLPNVNVTGLSLHRQEVLSSVDSILKKGKKYLSDNLMILIFSQLEYKFFKSSGDGYYYYECIFHTWTVTAFCPGLNFIKPFRNIAIYAVKSLRTSKVSTYSLLERI